MSEEGEGFLRPSQKEEKSSSSGCSHSPHASRCCVAVGVFGFVFVVLGIVVVLFGKDVLEAKILQSMALVDGTDRYASWLRPPVQPHLSGYAFHVTNPDEVLRGAKPIVVEKGPYVYRSTTVKDSDQNVVFNDEEGTLKYRMRKFYQYVPELSGAGLDPEKDTITVPNIPFWTGMNKLKGKTGIAASIGLSIVTSTGRGTPFVNVSFDGLLWGYDDELPCLKLDKPKDCKSESDSVFSDDSEDDWGNEDDWGDDWGRKRRKRSTANDQDEWKNIEKNPNSEYAGLAKPKAEFVDCKCQWGLFRDRNVTMREPIEIFTGASDLRLKGVVKQFNDRETLGWWKAGSVCDAVKGQDSSTLPPGLSKTDKLDIFISLMCRGLEMEFEKEMVHANIKSLRYIPTKNSFNSHDDPDPLKANPENECFCLKDENFKCFKSGVLNMEPCKRDTGAPLALSFPHFYNADPSFTENVLGLQPEKEKHQFYLDVMPEFGFPLAIRPRFQLNIVIGNYVMPEYDVISQMREEIVLPFLWAQDGFDEPSAAMADAIKFGLSAPDKIPLMLSGLLFLFGAILLLVSLGFLIWKRRWNSQSRKVEEPAILMMSTTKA